jgi:hypothetical protein
VGEETFAVVGLLAGTIGVLLGALAGAWISRVTLWKGPAIVAAGLLGQILVSLLLMLVAGYEDNFILGWVLFVVFAGLTARGLGVGVRASSVIIIGGLLAMLLSAIAVTFVLMHFGGGSAT